MTLDEILQQLDDPDASYQWDAVDAAVEHKDEITPLLLQRLEAVSRDPQLWLDFDSPGLLYTIVLLAHFRESAAHAALLRLARQPDEIIEPLLGDAITETLPVALWQTRGGDLEGVRGLVDERVASPWSRSIAAEVVTWGALFGTLDREDTLAWLAQRLDDPAFAAPGDWARDGVLLALLDLYPESYEAVVRAWLRSSHEPGWGSVGEADLDALLAQDREVFLEGRREGIVARIPDDIHDYLSHWAGFQPEGTDRARDRVDNFLEWIADELYEPPLPPLPEPAAGPRGTRPKPPPPATRKKKRKQQKKARKAGRKGK